MALPTGIGLYIGDNQIRAVKLRRTSRGVSLQRLGSAATPPGAISGGVPLDVRLLAECIRRLLKGYDITGNSAVVGLPGRAATSRVLELPTMSKEEMRSVVAGEMEHYRMIPPGQGTFDFVSLGETTEGSQSRVRLLLMAADKRIVDGYREALRLAGLQMSALEPMPLAAARAVFPALSKGGVALITVGEHSTQLAVFDEGSLRYCRQIDTGAVELAGEMATKEEAAQADSGGEAQPEGGSVPEVQVPRLQQAAVGNLPAMLYEIQRSLDFYHREVPQAARVERVVLCADTDQLRGLDSYLERNLGLPVSISDPFLGIHYSDAQFNPDFLAKAGAAFTPTVGLALRALEEVPQAPRMDLSVTGPDSILAKAAPKRLTWALVFSVILVVAALITAVQLSRALGERKRELAVAKEELNRITVVARERTTAAQRAQEAQEMVQMRGLPWSGILQQVAEFMPQGSWLTNLSTESANLLSFEGGALSADAVATLMDSLAQSPLFQFPHMTYVQKDTTKSRPIVKFQIKVQVAPPLPPVPRGAQAAPTAGPPGGGPLPPGGGQ